MSRLVAYDIEATGLKADFAFLLCAGFGVIGETGVKLLSLSDYVKKGQNPLQYERLLVQAVAEEIAKADMLISYYGKGFDRPFLNAKMIEYGLPPLPNIPEVDLYFTVKSNLAISRKSLANVAYYAAIENKKTMVEGRLWKAAQIGDRKALREIELHNIADVEVLRDVYSILRPYVRNHPFVSGHGPCRYCGEETLQSRGYCLTKLKGRIRRLNCQNCGGWDSKLEPATRNGVNGNYGKGSDV